MTTLTNERTGQSLETKHTNAEACALFAQHYGDKESFLWYWIHKHVQDATRVNGTGQHDQSISFIADSFLLAIGYGLKRPMIRVHYKDQRFKLYLSQKGTICLKSGMLATLPTSPGLPPVYTHDPVGDEFYVGCLLRGAFMPGTVGYDRNSPERPLTATENEFLAKLRENPTEFLAQCSKDMNRCTFCPQPLEDPRSKAVGCGERCAKRWGVAWGLNTETEKAPSFAKAYNEQGHGLCGHVRDHAQDEMAWNVFGDWLEENGLPRCTKPAKTVVLPRNDSNGKTSTTAASPVNRILVTAPVTIEQEQSLPPNQRLYTYEREVMGRHFAGEVVLQQLDAHGRWRDKDILVTITPEPTQRTINSKDLRWNAKTQRFSAEASSMGWKAGEWPLIVNVVSQKTGAIKTFTGMKFHNPQATVDVTFAEWTCEGLTLRLYND